MLTILQGDALTMLRTLTDESVQCCVTSPPFWGLRDYGTAKWNGGDQDCDHKQGRTGASNAHGYEVKPSPRNRDGVGSFGGDCAKCGAKRIDSQLGLEKTPEEYVAKMVEIFREVRRVLRNDGTLWLNLGDSYAAGGRGSPFSEASAKATNVGSLLGPKKAPHGYKPKDLVGIPWMVAFALRADGWYLRSDIIWHKPNPMPESVSDRPTKSHEYLFLLTRSPRYSYNADAIKEPCRESSIARLGQEIENQLGSDRVPGKTNGRMKAVKFGGNNRCPDTRLQSGKEWKPKTCGQNSRIFQDRDPNHSSERKVRPHGIVRDRALDYDSKEAKLRPNNRGGFDSEHDLPEPSILANKRSVWSVSTLPYKEAHFATYPPNLIKPCILAGSRPGDVILDPFAGSGTSGQVALELGRKAILIELNPKYVELIERRCAVTPGLALA